MTVNSPTKKKKKSYHHGDLRQALILAAVEIIAEREQAEFTLRELARRLNVTHAATYHHFADKDDLLAAVAQDGFERLLKAIQEGVEGLNGQSILIMRAIAASYLLFAVENPGHFRVMYQRDYTKEPSRFEKTIEAVVQQREYVDALWQRAFDEGFYNKEADREEMSAASWALLHGLAMLHINGIIEHPEGQSLVEYSSRITRHLYVGLASAEGRERVEAASVLK